MPTSPSSTLTEAAAGPTGGGGALPVSGGQRDGGADLGTQPSSRRWLGW